MKWWWANRCLLYLFNVVPFEELYYTFMAPLVGRYEGLLTRRSHISRGRRPREIWLMRVNKALYLPRTGSMHCLLNRKYTHYNETFFFYTNLKFYSICEGLFTRRCHNFRGRSSRRYTTLPMGARGSGDTWYLFPGSTRSRDTWSFVFLTCDVH